MRQVSKTYSTGDENVPALRNLSLQIDAEEFVALIGPSGSGKSTLLSVLGVLNPPDRGEVIIDGFDVYRLSLERRADFRSAYLGFVFQELYLLSHLNALENVLLPQVILKRPLREQHQKAYAALEAVGLKGKEKRFPRQLSGGEQGRVALARAIVNHPPLLLADEPTGSLDSKTGEGIMELLRELNRQGQTIVMVTHNADNLRYVSRTLELRDGELRREDFAAEKPGMGSSV
jgi:putative ABC transport system ATP-binding protein